MRPFDSAQGALRTRDVREWNAGIYHRVSNPQLAWGVLVLERLPLGGSELVLDVGCGTGRLTEKVLERVPRGRVVGVDQSANMLAHASRYLGPRFAGQVRFAQANATALPFAGVADAIFSTATFHWVLDHDRLFASLLAALKPGARLVAQCGGANNLHRMHQRCASLMADPEFAPHYARWTDPWEFADASTTEGRLRRAGFEEVRTNVEISPVFQPDAGAYREFIEHVICRPHLAHLPDAGLRDRFLDRLTEQAALDSPPFVLDYTRLNMDGTKPRKCGSA